MKKRKKFLLLTGLGLLFCLCLLTVLYPLISNSYAEQHQSVVRTKYEAEIRSNDGLEDLRQAADAYNRALASGLATELPDYWTLLDPTGSGIMGYVVIPKISVEQPIYHGGFTSVPDNGAAHLQGTSLPVGGESTHAVISGHSGMAGKKMFTDLEQLTVGDVFYIDVLGTRLAYQVDQISTVLPNELDAVRVEPGRDLVTLLTCTPYGVNSHRLLVRGTRIDEKQAEELVQQTTALTVTSRWEEQYRKGIFVGLAILAALAAGFGIWRFLCGYIGRKKRHD